MNVKVLKKQLISNDGIKTFWIRPGEELIVSDDDIIEKEITEDIRHEDGIEKVVVETIYKKRISKENVKALEPLKIIEIIDGDIEEKDVDIIDEDELEEENIEKVNNVKDKINKGVFTKHNMSNIKRRGNSK